ncbi:nuclear transport factor 2 family protein [Pseudoroseomonas ludipueritiae]|uniref:Nuclear transport factor 2 family protein n=1 Tax=Pseudoroseomonas ludipueritiae TaxID=198093 RepID=A0ABR7R6N5_9PROT|nr:nuclear transport factor 2 family protein [Pseudoroseomonas ludipueritiae]MBC9177416.1 nuclear transport factor 2 family protein [Pseudoroseomonas ludipueritiae]
MQDEIRALEARRYDAMLRGDVDALAALLSERAVYAHSDATRDSKAEYLASLSTGSLRYLEVGHSTEMVLEAGPDCAAALGRMHASIIRNGAEKRIASLTLAVWARESGEWRLLAYQPTAMKA